jgi:hypothetical protein
MNYTNREFCFEGVPHISAMTNRLPPIQNIAFSVWKNATEFVSTATAHLDFYQSMGFESQAENCHYPTLQ